MRKESIPESDGIKVVIGTRTYLGSDWVHVDIDPFPLHEKDDIWHDVDIVCDARNIPLPDNHADVVFSSECLEHFPWKQYQEALKEWARILKPGGLMRIEVPDFLAACRQIILMDSLEGDRSMQQIFFAEQMNPNDFHFVGLTHRMLADDLENLGFEVTNIKRGDESNWSEYNDGKRTVDRDYVLMVDARKLK